MVEIPRENSAENRFDATAYKCVSICLWIAIQKVAFDKLTIAF
jgi:hypothetical protein